MLFHLLRGDIFDVTDVQEQVFIVRISCDVMVLSTDTLSLVIVVLV